MMLIPGFFLLLLFLFASGLFASVKYGIRAEKVFLPSLILNAFLLYVCSACHFARDGFLLILAANLSLYIPVLFRMKQEGVHVCLKRFLTPGIIFALLFICIFFVLTLWRKFYSWDEISHWGAAAKLFFRDGCLGCEYGGILSHASYPPGTCLVSMLTHFCFFGVPFRENLVMFGHELLLLGIWLYPLSGLKPGARWQNLMISLAYLGFVPVFLREDFHTCYTDAPLACLFGLCAYAALTQRSRWELFALALMVSFLFPVRNAGFGYAVMILAFFLFLLIADWKKRDKNWLLLLLLFALPFAVKYSWSYLLAYHETPLKFGGTSITPEAIYNAFVHNIPSKSRTVICAFLIRLLCGYLEFFIALLFGFSLLRKQTKDPERAAAAKRGAVFFSLAFFLFLLTTLIYYIFEFNELKTLPSFDRYVSAFLIAPSFLLLFLWNDEWTAGNPANETGWGMTSLRRKRLFWILTGWCFIATLYNFIPPFGMMIWRKHRLECNRMKEYDAILSRPDIRFGLITGTGKGYKNFYGSYLYPEQFRELKAWDPVLVQKKGERNWDYVTVTTPDGLRAEILEKALDYIYIESVRKEFLTDFASMIPGKASPLKAEDVNNRLYKVLPDGNLQEVPLP